MKCRVKGEAGLAGYCRKRDVGVPHHLQWGREERRVEGRQGWLDAAARGTSVSRRICSGSTREQARQGCSLVPEGAVG